MSLGVVFHAPGLRHVAIVRDPRPLAAFSDGPVADTAEPVAAEAGRPIPEPDRDDTHTMAHKQ